MAKAKTYKNKSLRLGQGGQFAKMKDSLMKKGMTEERAAAVTANAGREKYGQEKMTKWSVAGKKRAAKKKKGK